MMNGMMKIEKLNKVLNKILNLVLLNFLWIGGTLLGLVIFGIGPSTLAVLAVIREWFRGNDDLPIFKEFAKHYKSYLKEGFLLSLIYGITGLIIVIDFIYVTSWEFKIFFGVVLFLYTISLVYVLPIVVHYDLKTLKEKILYSFLIGFSYLQYTLVMLAIVIAVTVVVAYTVPTLFTLYGISFPLFMIMWNAMNVFKIIEVSYEEEKEEGSTKRKSINKGGIASKRTEVFE